MPTDHSIQIQGLLDRLGQGDDAARNELVSVAYERLRLLARTLLHQDFPRLDHGTETILHESLIRLLKALREVRPASVRDFFAFSAVQMRRVLIDLARRRPPTVLPIDQAASAAGNPADGPLEAALWVDFHRQVDTLPLEQREVVDLHWYQGLTQAETARILGIPPKLVSRRWLQALVKLAEWMPGIEQPLPARR
jgi:RNA polymerase sigma-70 factor (ECF subfamily)